MAQLRVPRSRRDRTTWRTLRRVGRRRGGWVVTWFGLSLSALGSLVTYAASWAGCPWMASWQARHPDMMMAARFRHQRYRTPAGRAWNTVSAPG